MSPSLPRVSAAASKPGFSFPALPRCLLLFLALTLASGEAGPGLRGAGADPRMHETLYRLCDALIATQRGTRELVDAGALECPSRNPQFHPLHPRAGEAVYPLAIAYRETQRTVYRDAALSLARWMISKQKPSGDWGEGWPLYDGWSGTTADQLISLAGAYQALQGEMGAADRALWQGSIRQAASHVAAKFPLGNVNYQPTGAVALVLASRVLEDAPAQWRSKAEDLIALTLRSVNGDGFIVGEGNGVDLGYNLAQSIGFIALYGQLTDNEALREKAAALLRVHLHFVYPNGSIDNSWGTRSFKWVYESGTKTAPGVYFTFALLADKDPRFALAGRRCLDFLLNEVLKDGLVGYGPHAAGHSSTAPPCLYSSFTRAQSLAMAVAYGQAPAKPSTEQLPADLPKWFRYFPSIQVAVVRTPMLMATVSAYGEISRYGRTTVPRGGSLSNLWIAGFGHTGFAQTSSVSVYQRMEGTHMPDEGELKPLTSRIETTIGGITYSNIFEAEGRMDVSQETDHVRVRTSGELRAANGSSSGIRYQLTHRFYAHRLVKEYALEAAGEARIRLIEPIVRQPGLDLGVNSPGSVGLRFQNGPCWTMTWVSDQSLGALSIGEESSKYWCPFPAVACVPVIQACCLEKKLHVTMELRAD